MKSDCRLQDEFNKLRDKKYTWAMFIIKTELDDLIKDKDNSSLPRDRNDIGESLPK